MVIPVEYGVAVDHYLSAAALGESSRRVYRIALATWAWLLVDRVPPAGPQRRGAVPPVLPLAVLDGAGAAQRVGAAFEARAAVVGARTANRELSALRGAVGWWCARGWLASDPTAGLTPLRPAAVGESGGGGGGVQSEVSSGEPGGGDRARRALALRAPLREKVLWHLVHETSTPVERLLALDVDDLDLPGRHTRGPSGAGPVARWRGGAARLLPLLVLGRSEGPLFLTGRRAPAGTPAADRCPLTGRARLSYRRAAELFTTATRPLDPAGRGWTLLDLRSDRVGRSGS